MMASCGFKMYIVSWVFQDLFSVSVCTEKYVLKFLYFKLPSIYITGIKHLARQSIAYNPLRDIISNICDPAQVGKFFYFIYFSS